MVAPLDLPDWTRGYVLIGQDSSDNPVVLLVDDTGQLQIPLLGEDAGGGPQIVQVDSDGQLYVVLRGAGDVDVAVDGSGRLSALVKGIDDLEAYHTLITDRSGQIIMVPRGQSGHYLTINAAGFMTAVLKGGPDDALVTLSVDSEGRIQAFGLDAEDHWSKTLKTGPSEQAARLGSPVTYDWRGQTLVYNTFEHGKGNLFLTLGGGDAKVYISPAYWLMGGYSLRMEGDSDGTTPAKIRAVFGSSPTSRVGLCVAWSGQYIYDKVQFSLLVRKGATRYIGRLEYDAGSYTFKYADSAGDFQSIETVTLNTYPDTFNFLKLVIDTSTGKYVRALLNAKEHDLSAHALETDALGFSETIQLEIEVYSNASNNDGIYLDRYVITVNEPE